MLPSRKLVNLKSVKLNVVGIFYRIRLKIFFGGHCWGMGTSRNDEHDEKMSESSLPHVLFLEHLN